jgi:tetratricopeptide (TPR) repeat protein
MRVFNCCFVILFFMTLISCASKPAVKEGSEALYGMIYDGDNKPVHNAAVYINGKHLVSSDIHGRFTLSRKAAALPWHISVQKQGYETILSTLDEPDPGYVLYMRIFSADQIITQAEEALKEKNWGKTESLLNRAEQAGAAAGASGFLRGILAFYQNQYARAAEILLEIAETEKNAAHLYLFLADLYQYYLEDAERALIFLEQYLSLQYDPELRSRVEGLKESARG